MSPNVITKAAFARMVGVSKQFMGRAIEKRIPSGCLVRGHNGQVVGVTNVAEAQEAWRASADHSKAPGYVKERETARAPSVPRPPRAEPPPRPPADPPGGAGDDVEGPPEDVSLVEQTAKEKFWKAKLAELDFRKRSGELVEAKEVEAQLSDLFANCRNKLLGVPSRARQQDPALTRAQILLVEELIREALEELASAASSDEEPEPLAAGASQ